MLNFVNSSFFRLLDFFLITYLFTTWYNLPTMLHIFLLKYCSCSMHIQTTSPSLSFDFPTPYLLIQPFHVLKSQPTLPLKSPSIITFFLLLREYILYFFSCFASWSIHTERCITLLAVWTDWLIDFNDTLTCLGLFYCTFYLFIYLFIFCTRLYIKYFNLIINNFQTDLLDP